MRGVTNQFLNKMVNHVSRGALKVVESSKIKLLNYPTDDVVTEKKPVFKS